MRNPRNQSLTLGLSLLLVGSPMLAQKAGETTNKASAVSGTGREVTDFDRRWQGADVAKRF